MSQTTETKTKTPVERLEEWIAALRSGKYEQGRQVLRNGARYCCLGVMCDLMDRSLWRRSGWFSRRFWYQHMMDMPTYATLGVFGINIADAHTLAEKNDRGDSFAQIADYIESTILPRVRREQEGR